MDCIYFEYSIQFSNLKQKKNHNIIYSTVINSHIGPVYIETPYISSHMGPLYIEAPNKKNFARDCAEIQV